MQEIVIQNHIHSNFNASEHYLIRLPKWSFDRYIWSSMGDKFVKFAADILTFTLLNLLLNKTITCNYEIKVKHFLGLFKYSRTYYFFKCTTDPSHQGMSHIEQKILDLILTNPSIGHKKLIDKLIGQWPNDDYYINMGKYIAVDALRHQKLHFFGIRLIDQFLDKSVVVKILPTYNVNTVNEIIKNIVAEIDVNPIFSKLNLDFNKYALNVIEELTDKD